MHMDLTTEAFHGCQLTIVVIHYDDVPQAGVVKADTSAFIGQPSLQEKVWTDLADPPPYHASALSI